MYSRQYLDCWRGFFKENKMKVGYKNPGEMHLWVFDLISQILAFDCAVRNGICGVGGPVGHQFLSPSHLMFFLCVTHGLLGLAVAGMSLCFRRVVWSCRLGMSVRGFLLGMWERGEGRRSSPAVSGTATFKAQVFDISTVETVKEFWHLSLICNLMLINY